LVTLGSLEERGQMMLWLKWDNRRAIIIWLKRAEDDVSVEKFAMRMGSGMFYGQSNTEKQQDL
jgi:hypothetical protein